MLIAGECKKALSKYAKVSQQSTLYKLLIAKITNDGSYGRTRRYGPKPAPPTGKLARNHLNVKQVSQLSQRDRAAGWVNFGQK